MQTKPPYDSPEMSPEAVAKLRQTFEDLSPAHQKRIMAKVKRNLNMSFTDKLTKKCRK